MIIGRIWSLNKLGNQDKVNYKVLVVCGFERSSSMQAGYHWTLSIEGDALEKVVWWFGDVDRWIEVGTPIRITRRNIARHSSIQMINCVFQYHGMLKAERQMQVQVVLLCIVPDSYQTIRMKWSKSMEAGMLQRVVKYFFAQKERKLGWQATTFTIPQSIDN